MGKVGDELADAVAKRGGEGDGRLVQIDLPYTCVKNEIEQAAYKEWNTEWTRYAHGRQTKIFLATVCSHTSKDVRRLVRQQVTRLTSAITGHGPFGYHQYLVGNSQMQLCRFCGDQRETFDHFYLHCPAFMRARSEILGEYMLESTEGWTVGGVVKFSESTALCEIFEQAEGMLDMDGNWSVSSLSDDVG